MAKLDVAAYQIIYRSSSNRPHFAIQVPWDDLDTILGHEFEFADDGFLRSLFLEAGAPEWVKDAPCRITEKGWVLIGPIDWIRFFDEV